VVALIGIGGCRNGNKADVADLRDLADATFDLVYTGGHVAVWVSDLKHYYTEAARSLRPERLLIVSEYHPFRRVWVASTTGLELGFNYFNRGPHRFEAGQGRPLRGTW